MDNIFTHIDNFKHTFIGFNPLGALKNISAWRKYIFLLLAVSVVSWATFGWESTWSQPFHYIKSLPALLTGQVSLATVNAQAAGFYGIGQHLSSAIIYGVSFLLLSIHFEKLSIRKSLNFALTVSLSFMSVGIYEIVYNALYSTFQNQAWTMSFVWKQGMNLGMFVFFVFLGIVSCVYLYSLNFRFNFNSCTKVFLVASILTYALWIFYPFPVSTLAVGEWTSTTVFPQTMYAVGPVDGIAMGEPYFVENNILHLVNILNKLFVSLTVLSFVMVRRNEHVKN